MSKVPGLYPMAQVVHSQVTLKNIKFFIGFPGSLDKYNKNLLVLLNQQLAIHEKSLENEASINFWTLGLFKENRKH